MNLKKMRSILIVKNSRKLALQFYSSSPKQLELEDLKKFRPVIGLELHAQLATRTKLFSPNDAFDIANAEPNSRVSPFDCAIPGTLPSLSRSCVEKSILAAFLLNCEVADFCRFDRKHYFYPDLPLGYQITQKAQPIAKNGYLEFFAQPDPTFPSTSQQQKEIYKKRVRIQQIQLEMDSGKTIRDDAAGDLLDLNRAGLALIEIVTSPEFDTPMEVGCFVEHLRLLLVQNGICSDRGHEGNLRVDANISISQSPDDLGTRTELKNLSNVGLLMNAIGKELKRQIRMLKRGERVEQETRAVDSRGETKSARAKDARMDYRFLPEPNLPPMAIEPNWLDTAKRNAQFDLPHFKLIHDYGFPPTFAFEIVNNKKFGTFMRAYLAHGLPIPFMHISQWLKELEYLCQKLSITYPPTNENFIHNFAKLIHLEWSGRLTKLMAIELLREMANGSEKDCHGLEERIEREKLWRISDPEWIDQLVAEALEAQSAGFLERLLQGKQKPMAKLKRAAIERSGRRAAPEDVEAAIGRKISQQFTTISAK